MNLRKMRKSISLPRDLRFFELNKPTSIFQEIYNKIRKDENKNNLNINKTEEFLNIIENMRLKEEMIETEKDYIIKESRKEVRLNQELEYLYGKKRENYKKTKNFGKIKLDKKIFLNPLEKKEKNHLFSKCKSNVNILKLPIITNYNNNSNAPVWKNKSVFKEKNKIFNSDANLRKISFNEDSMNDSKKINDSNVTYHCQKNKNIRSSKKKQINAFLNTSTSRHHKVNKQPTSRTINSIFIRNQNSLDIDILNAFTINKKIKMPVIYMLDNINEELKSDEIKHKKYFKKHDYGCELSKFKINYLEKHFFQ